MSDNKIVMLGCHFGGYYLIDQLLKRGVEFSYFVCLTADQAEKHKVSGYVDYRPLAEKYGIPVYTPEKFNLLDEKDLNFFKENGFSLLIQGGWQRIIPQEILDTFSIGAIGVHGSSDLLPKGRGRSPLNWSLILGKKRFLLHLFLMKAGADDGDVFDVDDFDINEFDDINSLYKKISISARNMLLRSMPRLLSHNISVISQQGEPSYFDKRSPSDGYIDWEKMDVFQVYNLIRATTRPYPGAFAKIEGEICTIWKARPFDTRLRYPNALYGEIVENFSDAVVINCLGGLLLVEDYEPRLGCEDFL